jgi:ribose transport system permease protein
MDPSRRGIWILNVAILIALAVVRPRFFDSGNLESVLAQMSIVGIGAAGMTVLIAAGAFDLSVTGIMGLAPVAALTIAPHAYGLVVILLAVVCGALAGCVNGLVITRGNVTPFVATLGTLFIFSSVAAIISAGNTIAVESTLVTNIGAGSIGSVIPYSLLIMVGAFALCYVILRRLHFGRWVRASGSNLLAAHVSGINVRGVYLRIFILSGALTGLAGILLSGLLFSANAAQAPNYNLNTIAVVVIGGTSLMGGEATLVGTALGAWLFAVVSDALTLLGTNSYWQYVATGAVLILALALNLVRFGSPVAFARQWTRPAGAPGEPA